MKKTDTYNPHSDILLEDTLDSLQAAAGTSFEVAHPIPAAVHHSRSFFEHEQRRVFNQEWICIGRTDELPNAGDFLSHQIANVPVMVVRQDDGTIKAFVNACAHRYACLTKEIAGNTKRFTCPYHAWTYDLDGQLIRASFMDMKENFDVKDHRLRGLHHEEWQGFIYVTLSEKPKHSVNEVLVPFTENIIGRFDLPSYKTVMRREMTWGANWKNLIENFTESYHVPIAHLKTFALHKKPLIDYICGEDNDYYGYHLAPQAADTGAGAAHPANTRLTDEWRRMMVDFCIFPNHLNTVMPDFLWWISVQPIGPDQFHATWGVAIPPEVLAEIPDDKYDEWLLDMETYMDTANGEDKLLVEALHKGSMSPVLPRGTYHPLERNLWQFTKYLARVCG